MENENFPLLLGGPPGVEKFAAVSDISADTAEAKIAHIESWLEAQKTDRKKHMLYLVMYDIEDHKVRTQMAKYLLKKGCMRIQKSVYLAKSSRKIYDEIYQALRDINQMYQNHDSIFLLPVPEEKFNHIKVIGKNVEFDLVTRNPTVLFV